MSQNKQHSKKFWLWAALLALLFAVPNPMITRMFVAEAIDPIFWVFARAGVAMFASLPFALYQIHRVPKGRMTVLQILAVGVLTGLSVIFHTEAIRISSASYVSIVALLYPIILIAVSVWAFKEAVTRRILAGVGFGVIGGVVLLIVPLVFSKGSMEFNVWATVLSICNLVFLAIATAIMRKMSERQVPFSVQICSSSLIIAIIAGAIILGGGGTAIPETIDGNFWVAIVYAGIGVTIFTRAISMAAYTHLGAATIGVLHYVQVFLAIALPVVILGETVSISMVLGGVLILVGVYILEHHKHHSRQSMTAHH